MRPTPVHLSPRRLKEQVLKWLPVTSNTAIDGEAPELGDSPIKAGESTGRAFAWACARLHGRVLWDT